MQSCFVTHRKKLEEVDFADEEFLHKKVKKGVFMRIMVCYEDYEDYEDYGVIFQKIHVAKAA